MSRVLGKLCTLGAAVLGLAQSPLAAAQEFFSTMR
mgnify:CR=1 FL=1